MSSAGLSSSTSPTRPTRSVSWPRSAASNTRRWASFLLGGASLRTPVILDGVSAGAAALVARAIAPEALAACIAGHRSAEPGHVAALNKLGLRPLVDLDLRLGEGTGALLALPIVQSAARAMHEVATFDSAGVTEK